MEDLITYRRGIAYVLLRSKPLTNSFPSVPVSPELRIILQVNTPGYRYLKGKCNHGDYVSAWHRIPVAARLKYTCSCY